MRLADLLLPKNKKYSIYFFIIIGILTLAIGFGMLNIEIDNDVTLLLPVNEETEFERDKIQRLSKEFKSNQLLFIAIEGDPFSLKKVKALWELCNEINQLEVVKSTFNPFNATYFKKVGPVFSIKKMSMKSYPKNQERLNELKTNISSNRYLVGSIISYDGKSAGIVVRMNYKAKMGKEIKNKNIFIKLYEKLFNRYIGPKSIDRAYFCEQVEEVIKKYEKDFTIYYAGVPVYEAKSKQYMTRDIFILIIPALLSMTFILFMNFRTTRGTVLPVISIILSMIWTLGIMGWFRYKLNIVGILIPPIIMTIGSSYTLHYLNSYYLNSRLSNDPVNLVKKASKAIFPTILMASMTTMVAFASFITARIEPIKMFGVFIILSIVLTLFFTFMLLSKILSFFNLPKDYKIDNVTNDLFSKALALFRKLVIPLRYLWVLIFVGVIIIFVFSIPKLKIETNAANFFKKTDKVKQSLVFLQKNFHGTSHYNITLRAIGNKRNYFKSKEGILAAKKIQDYFEKGVKINGQNMIGWNISPVSLLEDLNAVLGGDPNGIPDDEKVIKRFFSFLKASKDDGIKSIMNNNFSAITFQVRAFTDNKKNDYIMTEQELADITIKLQKELKQIADEDGRFTVELWGEIILLSRISKYLLNDQIWSLSITIILVFLITLILFRSPYYAFFSLVPLTFGVLMNFSIMSIFKIPLDAATVMIAALSIGIGIDDSIHFILHYKKNINKGLDKKEAILHTLTYTARPILFTSLALILGFIVFLLSSFRPIAFFGLLIAISMFNCTFATLFILPSFFYVTDKVRLIFHKKKN